MALLKIKCNDLELVDLNGDVGLYVTELNRARSMNKASLIDVDGMHDLLTFEIDKINDYDSRVGILASEVFSSLPHKEDGTFDGFVVAGGFALHLLHRFGYSLLSEHPCPNAKDIDIFCVGLSGVTMEEKEKHILSAIKNLSECERFNSNTRIDRSTFTISLENATDEQPVQFIIRSYDSVSQLLHGFDVGSCAVAFDGKRFLFTSHFKWCLEHRLNIVDPEKCSLNMEFRYTRYMLKGFNTVLPYLNVDSSAMYYRLRDIIILIFFDGEEVWSFRYPELYPSSEDYDGIMGNRIADRAFPELCISMTMECLRKCVDFGHAFCPAFFTCSTFSELFDENNIFILHPDDFRDIIADYVLDGKKYKCVCNLYKSAKEKVNELRVNVFLGNYVSMKDINDIANEILDKYEELRASFDHTKLGLRPVKSNNKGIYHGSISSCSLSDKEYYGEHYISPMDKKRRRKD